MQSDRFDVVVVGAGAAGMTAAIGLARAGFSVAVVEAAPFPGAENWSGCVYFCESLADPDILGPGGVEALAWERRLVERGFFATDGHGLLGMTFRDAAAFRHCYTVLRPIFDHHLAQVGLRHGVTLLNGTTAESLLRDGGRVVGVCTDRGPLLGRLVFLAEGDASHLVTREGYERSTERKQGPKFLQGIKQVIEFPAGEIERRFGVGPEEGVAYEMLLRNGTLKGRRVHLNAGGFLYANRQSLSIGLVLPADNLQDHFEGDPNLLMEWFLRLPSLRHWFEGGRPDVFGTKIIRGGGLRDVPTLIDDGLAIGGAASAIGIDFPYPNFTGPAAAMGLLLTRAARQIRAGGGAFTRAALEKHYLQPLQRTHYWQDVEFLSRWPRYVKTTKTFFGDNLDFSLQSAYLWTRPGRGLLRRWSSWLGLLLGFAASGRWAEMRDDFTRLDQALHVQETLPRVNAWRLLLDGTLNALRDLVRARRADVPAGGEVRLHYRIAGGSEAAGLPPAPLRQWFRRFAPVLTHAARLVYSNNDVPLARKLPAALQMLARQVNLIDLVGAGLLAAATGLSRTLLLLWHRRHGAGATAATDGIAPSATAPSDRVPTYADAVRRAEDLTPLLRDNIKTWEARLGRLEYHSAAHSHIHVLWPQSLPDKNKVTEQGLWHVCPAHVYEARVGAAGQVQVVVNYENCIKCETCWRTSDLVDWGRDGAQQFVYPVWSPAVGRLLQDMSAAALSTSLLPHNGNGRAGHPAPTTSAESAAGDVLTELGQLGQQMERKLVEFEAALNEEPRTVGQARAEYLDMLARYAQQLAARMVEVVHGGASARLVELARQTHVLAERCARHAWDRRFAWAAADSRQLRFYHLPQLEAFAVAPAPAAPAQHAEWLGAETAAESLTATVADWMQRLDAVLPTTVWRDLEHGKQLSEQQDQLLRQLVREIPPLDPEQPSGLHAPKRKFLLAELGRRDPSLAFRVAHHLLARDLAAVAGAPQRFVDGLNHVDDWACVAPAPQPPTEGNGPPRLAWYVPAAGATRVLLLQDEHLGIVAHAGPNDHLRVEPVPTLGLRGAGISHVQLTNALDLEAATPVEPVSLRRWWSAISSADLVSIAFGMADLLSRRATEHAAGRVQFPGLFHDEEARDAIGKFGAVKKMVAEIAAGRYLLETLDHTSSPRLANRAGLMKAVAAEVLGTAPGSVAYNAGQVFGGTAYSEDDVLSKYYRDAAAWRYLGPDNVEVFFGHGTEILNNWAAAPAPGLLEAEAELVAEMTQRQALQPELDHLRVQRARRRDCVDSWRRTFAAGGAGIDLEKGEFAEAVGRQDAYLWAGEALLLRTHARLEAGYTSETEIALLRVWLERCDEVLGELETVAARHLQQARREDRPILDPAAGPPVTAYAELLAAPGGYDSGDFLVRPVDLAAPRYVPEMVETDPVLAEADRDIRTELEKHFGGLRDGLVYERYVERQHHPDDADLDFLRRRGYFRMPIPKALGGAGRSKAEYYLLTTNSHRLADVAVSLTIQVNSSLGTTPVLLARDKDLPKAQKELEAFARDAALHAEIRDGLSRLAAGLEQGGLASLDAPTRALNKRLDEAAFRSAAVRVLAHAFSGAWQSVLDAAGEHDPSAFREALAAAQKAWQEATDRSGEFAAEMARRLRASDLFLRWVASGQISGFALTEPSAGSDTARVATRARPRSVPVTRLADGTFEFTPVGGKQSRRLLDADRIEFRPDPDGTPQPLYRWSDAAEPAPVCFDEYDYATDQGKRLYFRAGADKVYFHDVAQLRDRGGKPHYDYWELTGAKMWITNGRMCGILCLYAKTEEGVTGFVVDRHAEGLLVGKDEEKMGQCGSPTNELSLQSVRVPRENVIGLEGRGQVNALETLNVGRAGIAMSAMCQMGRIISFCEAFAASPEGQRRWRRPATPGSADDALPAPVRWRLARMQEERFICEAMAFDVIGKFEHKKTKSVRLESAAAKMLASELLHGLIECAEDVHGLAGQTQRHLIEKRKRDARVLNIYEGTNEIQRFFLLRDLVGEVARRWPTTPATPPAYLGPEALELTHLKAKLRELTEAAVAFLGQQLWQNPNLQANCFLLAEAVAWLGAADSTLGRLAWLWRREADDEEAEPSAPVQLGKRAFHRCALQARDRLRRFEDQLPQLKRGFYAPAIRAASLLFQRLGHAAPVKYPGSTIQRPFSILVVLQPPAPGVENPVVRDGELQEPYLVLAEADRSALEIALRLRDAAAAPCTIDVVAAGPVRAAHVLREVVSLGVDRVRLAADEGDVPLPQDQAAAALAALAPGQSYDLVLGGSADGEEGVLAPLVAARLGVPHLGSTTHVAVRVTPAEATALLTSDQGARPRLLPGAVSVTAEIPLRRFTTADQLRHLARGVEVVPWPEQRARTPGAYLARGVETPQAAAAETPTALVPLEASQLVRASLGLDGKAPGAVHRGTPLEAATAIEEVTAPFFGRGPAMPYTLAILAADGRGNLRPEAATVIRAARFVGAFAGADVGVVLLAPPTEALQRQCLDELAALTRAPVLVVPVDANLPGEVRCRLLEQAWAQWRPNVRAVVGEGWAESALVTLAGPALPADRLFARVTDLDRRHDALTLEASRHGGALHCRYTLANSTGAWWLTLADGATIGALAEEPGPAAAGRLVQRWRPQLDGFYGRADIRRLLDDLKQQAGVLRLSDAEFIIDVGFGVGNRDGYEAVIVPLENALRELGVRGLVVGGSRKVTEELHLLPEDRQIGQSGVSVNPRLLLAVGVSGAPQHLNYIGPRATIVAFNRDPDAPLMTLNRHRPQPRVYPVVGDLFETVPAFIDGLRQNLASPLAGIPKNDVTTPQ